MRKPQNVEQVVAGMVDAFRRLNDLTKDPEQIGLVFERVAQMPPEDLSALSAFLDVVERHRLKLHSEGHTVHAIFDFDETLTQRDSIEHILEAQGVPHDRNHFALGKQRILEGDTSAVAFPRVFEQLAPYFSQSAIAEHAATIPMAPGVPDVLDRLKRQAAALGLDLKIHLVSSGLDEVICRSPLGALIENGTVASLTAMRVRFDDEGGYAGVSQLMEPYLKIRALDEIIKGVVGQGEGAVFDNKPSTAPQCNLIVVGDGYSDRGMMRRAVEAGGLALGVYDPDHPESQRTDLLDQGQVHALIPRDYRSGSELEMALMERLNQIAEDQGIAVNEGEALGV